jgi:spermidine synthase
METKKMWFTDNRGPFEEYKFSIKEKIVDTTTQFQKAEIIDTHAFKKCLILDGDLQSAECDEFIYHESLVHPAMILHKNPENILILGGGEGSTLREVLKHKSVKRVVMVDIDGEVVEFCKKNLVSFHQNAFEDERVELIIDDAKNYIQTCKEKFDVIIGDLCCPVKNSPACDLYTKEFYEVLKNKLNDNGVFVLQSGPGDIPQLQLNSLIHNTLESVFETTTPFYINVPSFAMAWSFIIATKNKEFSVSNLSSQEVNKLLDLKVKGELKYYDGITHHSIFSIPKHIRNFLSEQKNLITKDKLFYLFQ